MRAAIVLVIACATLTPVLVTCSDDDDDSPDDPICSSGACQALCDKEHSSEVKAYGEIKGLCSPQNECNCLVTDCTIEQCDKYCGDNSPGQCELGNCLCSDEQ